MPYEQTQICEPFNEMLRLWVILSCINNHSKSYIDAPSTSIQLDQVSCAWSVCLSVGHICPLFEGLSVSICHVVPWLVCCRQSQSPFVWVLSSQETFLVGHAFSACCLWFLLLLLLRRLERKEEGPEWDRRDTTDQWKRPSLTIPP